MRQRDGRVFSIWMAASHRDSNTIIVATADHGESFSDGYWTDDSEDLHYAETQIRRRFRCPASAAATLKTEDGDLSDVAPSILAALAIGKPSWMDGHDLIGAANAGALPKPPSRCISRNQARSAAPRSERSPRTPALPSRLVFSFGTDDAFRYRSRSRRDELSRLYAGRRDAAGDGNQAALRQRARLRPAGLRSMNSGAWSRPAFNLNLAAWRGIRRRHPDPIGRALELRFYTAGSIQSALATLQIGSTGAPLTSSISSRRSFSSGIGAAEQPLHESLALDQSFSAPTTYACFNLHQFALARHRAPAPNP